MFFCVCVCVDYCACVVREKLHKQVFVSAEFSCGGVMVRGFVGWHFCRYVCECSYVCEMCVRGVCGHRALLWRCCGAMKWGLGCPMYTNYIALMDNARSYVRGSH